MFFMKAPWWFWLSFVGCVGTLGFSYALYCRMQQLETHLTSGAPLSIHPSQSEYEKIENKIIERLVPGTETWYGLQPTIKDTVVQIFAQRAGIDILVPHQSPTPSQGTGSGFFINAEGEIVTNWHVVDQAKMMYIQIPSLGKEQLDIELVGLSPDRDLALVRLTSESLKKVKEALGDIRFLMLGDSDLVYRGDEIMTIGYPLGQQSIKSTKGIVSGREQHLIQIDAAINPGNSGGPSVNIKGEVIGINSLYAPEAQSVGYIIPINELKIILNDLRKVTLLKKPFLGVLFNNGSVALTTFLGNPQPGGLYVVQTYKDSPLDRAGVLPRDMIYQIDGHAIDVYGELSWGDEKISLIDYVARLHLGQQVSLVVYRQGKKKELVFTFEQTEMLPIKKIYPGYEKIDYEIIGGMLFQPLTINHLHLLVSRAPGLTKYAEITHQMEPAIICTHLFPDSYGSRSRSITPGIVVREMNGQVIKTLDDVRKSLFASIDSGYLTLETTDSVFVVLPFDKVLADDRRLARDYFYTLTPGIQAVIQKMSKADAAKKITVDAPKEVALNLPLQPAC